MKHLKERLFPNFHDTLSARRHQERLVYVEYRQVGYDVTMVHRHHVITRLVNLTHSVISDVRGRRR